MGDFTRWQLSHYIPAAGSWSATGAWTLDASNDGLSWTFQAEEAVPISRLGYRVSVITGTAPTFRISLQGAGAGGNPDGVVKGGGSPASATFTPSGTGWFWANLANIYTPTRGEVLCGVIDYSSGTIDGSNNVSFLFGITSGAVIAFPFVTTNNAGALGKNSVTTPIFAYGTVSTPYGWPLQGVGTLSVSSNTTPDETGLRFLIPASVVQSYKVAGIWLGGTTFAAGKTYLMTLYDTDGTTVLQQINCDSDWASIAATFRPYKLFFPTTTLAPLLGGSAYRVTIAPQETASGHLQHYFEVAAAADLAAWPGGQEFYLTQRTDGGAWTDTTTRRPLIELIIDEWNVGGALPRARMLTLG